MGETVLLGLREGDVDEYVLPVFGEEGDRVTAALEAAGCTLSLLGRRRGSATFRAGIEGTSFTAVLAGYGSAAVAGTMPELVTLGGRTFVLGGTCGASRHHPLGEIYVLSRAVINPLGGPGAAGYHTRRGAGIDVFPSPALLEVAKKLGLRMSGESRVYSQDAFYGFGCVLDGDGHPAYAGPAPVEGKETPGFQAFLELYRSGKPYLLDMEAAFFYAVCAAWRGLRGIAIKGVSNHVPFDPEDYIMQEEQALFASLGKAVELVREASARSNR